MTTHQSLIDDALNRAKARISGGVGPTDKIASVGEGGSLIKEATQIADALEYVSLGLSNDGSAAGAARASMVETFLSKSAAGGGPVEGATATTGTQSQAPAGSKKDLLMTAAGKVDPSNSESLEGKTPENIMRQMPPGTAPTPKDGGGKTANLTLYDVLMSNKEAAGGGALEMDSEQALPQTPKGNEGKNYADSLLGSNSAPVAATRRQAKAPTRPRLAEAWAHTNDTVGDATARAIWPQASGKGDMKVAGLARAFKEEREKVAAPEDKQPSAASRIGKGLAAGGALGAAAGGALGAGIGHAGQKLPFAEKKDLLQKAFARGTASGRGGKADVDVAKGLLRHGKKAFGGLGAAGGLAAGVGAGALAGGAYHAYKKSQQGSDKKADALSDYSELFELAATGQLGSDYQSWAQQIEAV